MRISIKSRKSWD